MAKPKPSSPPKPAQTGARRPPSNPNAQAKARLGVVKPARRVDPGFLRPLIFLVLLGVVAYFYYSRDQKPASNSASSFPAEITVAQAAELYPGGAFFVDVREPQEYAAGHIPEVVNIPLGQLASRLSEIPSGDQIIVVCRSGNRSQEGRDILLQNGFANVASMAGGVSDWKAQGFPYEGEVLK